ncbi:MAG: hypothetical protein KJ000_22440 [Pirellulaceae bacterium]|nr:hypothetical protein [Pirellulaceae bacterium]
MLQYPYQPVPLVGTPPPSIPLDTTVRWRPFAPVTIIGPTGISRRFQRALIDSGADDSVFPLEIAARLHVVLRPYTGHVLRWRGQPYELRYGDVELELSDEDSSCRGTATVCFSAAPMSYRILGHAGCLQFFDSTFRGADLIVELEPNASYPGSIA